MSSRRGLSLCFTVVGEEPGLSNLAARSYLSLAHLEKTSIHVERAIAEAVTRSCPTAVRAPYISDGSPVSEEYEEKSGAISSER